MREIMYLTGYEYKKIFQKRSTWIALALVALWTVFSGISGIIGDYYVEGEKAGTRYQMVKKEREALEHPEIGELNEDFFRREQEMSELYAPYDNYHVLLSMIEQQVGKIDKESMTTEDFYKMRKVMLENISKGQNLSEGERAFHMKENEQITTPYAYGNMLGFDYYFRMLPLNFVFLSLAAAIILAPMFAGEYTSHMDGLVLSSRFGKNKLIQAKLLTGISFGFLASMLFGAAIGVWSRTQIAATAVMTPVMMVFAFLPMLAMFNQTIEKIADIVYSQHIQLLMNSLNAGTPAEAKNVIAIAANVMIAAVLFGIAYRRRGLM